MGLQAGSSPVTVCIYKPWLSWDGSISQPSPGRKLQTLAVVEKQYSVRSQTAPGDPANHGRQAGGSPVTVCTWRPGLSWEWSQPGHRLHLETQLVMERWAPALSWDSRSQPCHCLHLEIRPVMGQQEPALLQSASVHPGCLEWQDPALSQTAAAGPDCRGTATGASPVTVCSCRS